jgi:hypothetical protein
MDLRKLFGNVPLITTEGYIDPAHFPIESVLKQALSDDDQEFVTGLNMLRSMYAHGRTEAGVFLLGRFVNCDDNWEKRIRIVEAMTGMHTKPCANLLFGELKRVKNSNTTRRYLRAVIKVLSSMPSDLIEEGFETLAEDKSFSPKMREKVRAVLGRQDIGRQDRTWGDRTGATEGDRTCIARTSPQFWGDRTCIARTSPRFYELEGGDRTCIARTSPRFYELEG